MKKKECQNTRKALRRYLHGHLFKPEELKIERHLRNCALCWTEYQALKRSHETKRLLKDITPPEGVVQRVKEGIFSLSRLKKILYRPLWVAGIIAVAALGYLYAARLEERSEREFREIAETPSPATATSPATFPTATVETATPVVPAQKTEQAAANSTPAGDPLVITISTDNEQAAVKRINQAMQGHALLRKMRLGETVKEISGSLTAKELLTFFGRIEGAGKILYSRSRLESFPSAQPIPFVMRLKISAAPAQKPVVNPENKTDERPAPPAPAQ